MTGATLSITPRLIEYAASGAPFDITAGPDGNMWFTEISGARVGRVTPTGVVTEFAQGPTTSSQLGGITTGSDGNLWFTKRSPDRIGVMNTAGTVLREYAGNTNPREIITGLDGNLWITEQGSVSIDRLSPTGTFTYFPSGYGNNTIGIARCSDGNIWYAYNPSPGGLSKIAPTGLATRFGGPANLPHYLTAGPDGNMWYTNNGGSACIGRATLQGVSTSFCSGITTAGGTSFGAIVVGPDGNLWFTNSSNNRIDRITPTGVVTEYATGITAGAGPYGLALGNDGNLWFTEQSGNRVAKFVY